jgi:subtilase family serine protease
MVELVAYIFGEGESNRLRCRINPNSFLCAPSYAHQEEQTILWRERMKGIEKARMGIIAVLALMLVSIKRRLPATRELSSGITTLALAGIVLLVAAGSVSALGQCPPPGNTVVTSSCELTQSYTVPAGQHGYIIGADNIVIDGAGYNISGSIAGGVCFTGGEGDQPAGIYNYNASRMYGYSNVTIKNLEVKNFCTGILVRGAIVTKKVENNTIFRCNIHDNGDPAEDMNTFGIHLFKHVYNSTIDECEIHHNTGGASSAMACDSGGMGIRLKVGCSHNDIIQNYIHDNVHSGIFTKGGCKFVRVAYNNITGNGLSATGAPCGGITMRCKMTNNWIVEMNNVTDNFGPGMYVGGSYNTIRYNTVIGCKDVPGGDLPSGYAIEVGRSDGGGISNELYDNTFCNNNAGVVDISVCGSGSCTGNTGDDNAADSCAGCGGVNNILYPYTCDNKVSAYFDFDGDGYYSDDPANCACGIIGGAKCACCNPGMFNSSHAGVLKAAGICVLSGDTHDDPNDCDPSILGAQKPDLVITEKSETLDGSAFTVTYTVTNNGVGDAGASTTCIYVDGTQVATDPVGTLVVGATHEGTVVIDSFDCPCDTAVIVKVCADNENVVDESDEENNCLENTFDCPACPKPDLVITEKSETLDGSAFTVTYTVENIDDGDAGASTTCIYVDGALVATDPVGQLVAGATYGGTVVIDPFDCPCDTAVIVKVCADNENVVDESDEENNCLENTFNCPICKPDLTIIEKHEEWVVKADKTYNITYTVKNIGTATAPASTTSVDIDGNVSSDDVIALSPDAEEINTIGPYTMFGDSDVITLCADGPLSIDELDETNNCIENVLLFAPDAEIGIDQPEFVDPQSQFTINITVDPVDNEISAVQYDLYYNTSVVWAEWANPGSFLKQGGATTDVTVRSIDNLWDTVNHVGKISYAETTLGSGGILPSVNTPGILTTIHFSAIGVRNASSYMNISDVLISDLEKDPVPDNTTNCSVTIYNNKDPVANGTSMYRFSNVASKFQCFAVLCPCLSDGGDDLPGWGENITYIRWDFGDGQYGTSEGVDPCEVKEHMYTTWNWIGGSYEDGGYYENFTAYLTVRDDGEPQISNTTEVNVTVYIAGDTNGDGVVDIFDAACVGKHWNQHATGPTETCGYYWDEPQKDEADLNNDNDVDTLDAMIVGTNWNHLAYPPYYKE